MREFWRSVAAAGLLAMGLVVSSFFLSRLWVRVRQEQAIAVKGYAEREVVSDLGTFFCRWSARGPTLPEASERLEEARRRVQAYLLQAGFSESDLRWGSVSLTPLMKPTLEGKASNEIEGYLISQTVTVTSTNVGLIQDAAVGLSELIREGVAVEPSPPEYLLSGLGDLKMALLAEATRDGFQRAQTLARNSGGRVGALMSASQGVFQITARHSTEVSSWGIYDTSTMEKTVKAVVTLEYAIER